MTLLDRAGAHPPLDEADAWPWHAERLEGDARLLRGLARYGLVVERGDVEFPTVEPGEAGLLE